MWLSKSYFFMVSICYATCFPVTYIIAKEMDSSNSRKSSQVLYPET